MNTQDRIDLLIKSMTELELNTNNDKINLENHLATLRNKLEKEIQQHLEIRIKIKMITGMIKALETETFHTSIIKNEKSNNKNKQKSNRKNKHTYFVYEDE